MHAQHQGTRQTRRGNPLPNASQKNCFPNNRVRIDKNNGCMAVPCIGIENAPDIPHLLMQCDGEDSQKANAARNANQGTGNK